MKITNNIKEMREKHDMFQSDLAKLLNVDSTTVSSWERGRTEPSMEMVKRMCEVFHCNVSDLFESPFQKPDRIVLDADTIIESMFDMDSEQLKRIESYARKIIDLKKK